MAHWDLLTHRFQVSLGFECRHATGSGSCDRLTVAMIGHVSGDEDPRHWRADVPIAGHNVPFPISRKLIADEVAFGV